MFSVMSLKLFKRLLTVLITNYTPQKEDFRGANQNLDYPQNESVRNVPEHFNISPSLYMVVHYQVFKNTISFVFKITYKKRVTCEVHYCKP